MRLREGLELRSRRAQPLGERYDTGLCLVGGRLGFVALHDRPLEVAGRGHGPDLGQLERAGRPITLHGRGVALGTGVGELLVELLAARGTTRGLLVRSRHGRDLVCIACANRGERLLRGQQGIVRRRQRRQCFAARPPLPRLPRPGRG